MTEQQRHLAFAPTLDEQFEAMLRDRPDVYREFVTLALKAKRAGRARFGAKGVAEILRWNRMVERRDDDYAINNNFVSRMARKAMAEVPELSGFFATRELKSEDN